MENKLFSYVVQVVEEKQVLLWICLLNVTFVLPKSKYQSQGNITLYCYNFVCCIKFYIYAIVKYNWLNNNIYICRIKIQLELSDDSGSILVHVDDKYAETLLGVTAEEILKKNLDVSKKKSPILAIINI